MEPLPTSRPSPPFPEVAQTVSGTAAGQPLFFPVSILKLVVMSIVTFGFYQVYWFYRHWRAYQERTGAPCSPSARALFAGFFCHGLMREIKLTALRHGVAANYQPILLTVGWIAVSLMGKLDGPLGLVSFLAVLMLVPVQRVANRLNEQAAPGHAPNGGFSALNLTAIVIGGLLVVGACAGAFIRE